MVEAVVKRGDDALLQRGAEVDEDIAAAHQIELGERRIARQVVAHEDAQLAHGLADAVAAIDLDEEAAPPLVADVAQRGVGVDAAAGRFDRRFADVGAEDLDRTRARGVVEELEQRDGQRVDLFARRAAGDPQSNRRIRRLVGDDRRKDVLLDLLEDVRIAKERGDVDEHVFVQEPRLVGLFEEQPQVALAAADVAQRHAAVEPTLDRRRFVLAVVDPDGVAHDNEDLLERLVVLLGSEARQKMREIWMTSEPRQLAGELCRRHGRVDDAGVNRALRHAGELRRRGILDQRDAVLGLDRLESRGAVGGGARHDDGDGLAAEVGRQRAEEEVDGQVRPPRIARARQQRERAVEDAGVGVGRDDVDVIALDGHAVADLDHRHRRRAAQCLRQKAVVLRVEVLNEHEGHTRIDRQAGEQLAECFEAAGGSADADDGKRRRGVARRW